MNAQQLDMFTPSATSVKTAAVASMRDSWVYCWGWSGPEVGGLLEVATPIVQKADDSGSLYCYSEQARVESMDGDELVVVLEGNAYPGTKDGTRLRLDILDVWAPTRALRSGLPIYSPAAA